MKEQKKNTGSALIVESVYSAQNAQFRLVMNFFLKFENFSMKIIPHTPYKVQNNRICSL